MGKINEFLTYSAPFRVIVSKVEKILNVKLNELTSYWGSGINTHSGREEDADREITGKEYFTNDLKYDDISDEQFESLSNAADMYRYSLIILGKTQYNNKYELTVIIRKKEKKQKIYTELNLFVHGSNISPEIINRLGLRTKNPWLKNMSGEYDDIPAKQWFSSSFSQDGDLFRVYMSALDLCLELKDNKDIEAIIDCILLCIRSSGYGKYTYLIKLPPNYPVFKDPEGDTNMAWVFTTYPIPPKYILYIGYEDEVYSKNGSHPAVTREEIRNFIEN